MHHDNDFCVCLTNLAKQHYEISELEHECKLFDINGSLQDTGYFLYDGEEKHITLINEEDFIGCMEINKQVEDEDGTLRRPQRWERFDVIVESEEYKRKIVLSHENDFCMRLYDLPKVIMKFVKQMRIMSAILSMNCHVKVLLLILMNRMFVLRLSIMQ